MANDELLMDNWREIKLKSLGDFLGGGTPSTMDVTCWNGNIDWLIPSDISNYSGNFISKTKQKITEVGLKKSSAKLLPVGTVCMSSRATIGDCVISNVPIATNQGFINIICNHKILNLFLLYWLRQNTRYILRYVAGTTFNEIGKSTFKKLKINLPPKPEQTAIATILSKVDEAIEATRQSIKSAEKLKKALMQNLLTGKLKPDGTWRTDDEFYEDEKFGKVPVGWEVKPVGDRSISTINPNYSFDKGKEYDFIPMDAINDGFRGVGYLKSRKIDGGGYTRFKLGDILFAKITPCTENGKVALITEMNTTIGFASTEFIIFNPKETIDNQFYYYLLSSDRVHNLAISLMEGTTGRQRVPWKVFKNRILAPFPEKLEEQKSISKQIKAIAVSNQSKQTKIQTLQRLKKSLMQNLLTGKVRVDIEEVNKIINEQANG